MCILCVVQKWSRRVATMLPWLVIPLIGLWALSQLLPPGFRFEITSPRLACVLVLLVTLFWYEILMPQLSAWRAHRSARLREKKKFEAIEMQKLKKMATRRCRNCLTPYRDQNPGGGRFMCSYCGHLSKRPVLDISGHTGLGNSNSGIIGDLVGKGGKIWNRKGWSENGWVCRNDWLENGNFYAGSFSGKSNFWGRNGSGFCSGDDSCLADKSYSGFVFACRLLASFFLSIRWLWRKIFGVTSSDDALSDAEHRRMLSNKGENGVNFHENKGEKARRKAEEKRQARLERELLEEEERQQREEVARLVEERRRLREEKIEVEQEHIKASAPDREKCSKREAERKRQERRKEKDKGSSKSNSDCEELERRAGKESEKKQEFDKRSEIERRGLQKAATESARAHSSENEHVIKATTANNFSRGSGARYLDRVKGSFISSSKAFTGASFFGKGAHTSANVVSRASKLIGSLDNFQASANRREIHSTDHIPGKLNSNGDDKISQTSFNRPVALEMQPRAAPKKSWQQLFTRSPAVPPFSNANGISRLNQEPQAEAERLYLHGPTSPAHPLDDHIRPGRPLPFTLSPFPNVSTSSLISSAASESMFPLVGGPPHDFISEEPEIFEDPCYIPDPVMLLGPVSEALDNFPLDPGTGFVKDTELERPWALKNGSASAEVSKPSPIESPLSRLRVIEERQANTSPFPSTPKTQNVNASPLNESSNAREQGTWQMWDTPSFCQDGFGLVGGPASWHLHLGKNKSNHEDALHLSSHNTVTSEFTKENQVLPGILSPERVHIGNSQNGGMFSPLGPGSNDPWSQKSVLQPLSGDGENHFLPHVLREDISHNEATYGRSATGHPFDLSPANCWTKKDWAVHGSGEAVGNLVSARPHIGGLFSTPDVQSLWSFN